MAPWKVSAVVMPGHRWHPGVGSMIWLMDETRSGTLTFTEVPAPLATGADTPNTLSGEPAKARGWRPGAVLLAAALVAGAVGGGVTSRLIDDGNSSPAVTSSLGGAGTGSLAKVTDIQQVLAKIQPSVVAIRTQAFQRGRLYPSQGAGSGTILSADGEVLTNAHVVDGATSIEVFFNGETEGRSADVIGVDSSTDVALVKIRDARDLPAASLGRSGDLRVGDSVVAIGNALDLGATPSVTEGIVSALNRSIDAPGESLSGLIQTDAAINQGNSGGPLVDAQGNVIGVNTAVAGDAQNIGFALAIDNVKPILDDLRANPGRDSSSPPSASRAVLGVTLGTDASGSGAVVAQVASGSPAADAGLRGGDVITAMDGQDIASSAELIAKLRPHKPGDTVSVTWSRQGSQHTARIQLASS